MKKCELCEKVARMYCNSDQASLCWDCDSRVHAANFLVSKHIRTLLCHACQSPTSWTGSGPKLGPTVSVCEACVNGRDRNIDGDRDPGNENSENDESEDEEEKTDDDDDDEENGDYNNHEEDDDDDSENQVVPLSPPPFLASTSSSSEESSSRRDGFSGSNLGVFKARTTVETARFSYNGVERPEEKNGTQNIRSWAWR